MTEIRIGASAIVVDNTEPMVAGSARIYHCRYAFSSEWDALDKVLYFRNGDMRFGVAVAPEGVCEIPWEVLQEFGELRIGAIGSDSNGTRRVVSEKAIRIVQHGTTADDAQAPREPTPGMVEQLHALARSAYDRAIEDLERRIESGEFRGEDGTTPHIGENGNWYFDDNDTGIRARGRDGNDHAEAENARASAEQNRISAENARASAESARENAEQSRASAESARAASESGRVDAENARAAAENSRASAEQTRANNESARQSAESSRANAEQNRVDAESARASAESARANASASAVNAANAAAERAEEAADACVSAVAEIPAQMDAAVGRIIDDAVVSASNPWSSQQIVETLCPPIEVSGNPVTCYPVAGSPLNVSARVEPVQHMDWVSCEGLTTQDGTPSPDAPVPLVDSVPAGSYYVPSTAPDGGYWRVDLDAALAGVGGYNDALEIDAYSGRWRIVRKTARLMFDGAEDWRLYSNYCALFSAGAASVDYGGSTQKSSHYSTVRSYVPGRAWMQPNGATCIGGGQAEYADISDLKAYLAAQSAAGTPVTIRYAVAEPIITTGQATHVTSTTGLTALNAVSMGLSAPDPEHPCEITVADAVRVKRTGRNLLLYSTENVVDAQFGITAAFDAETQQFRVQGQTTYDGAKLWMGTNKSIFPTFKPGEKYVLQSQIPTGMYILITYRDANNVIKSLVDSTIDAKVFTVPIDYVRPHLLRIGFLRDAPAVDHTFTIQITYGDTPAPYEPYVGDTYDVALPDGFDGGEVDVTSGRTMGEWGKIVLDGTETSITQGYTANSVDYEYLVRHTLPANALLPKANNESAMGAFFTHSEVASIDSTYMRRRNVGISPQGNIHIYLPNVQSIDAIKAYLAAEYASGHPVTIYYKLSAPTESTIEPVSIPALSGCNTLSSDAQGLTVRGRADPIHIITEQSQTLAGLTQRMAALESAVTQ